MLRAALLPLALAAALSGCGSGAKAANDNKAIPALTGRVVDKAELLDAATERRLTAQLAALERSTRDQLVVVTLPSLEGEEIEAVGMALGKGWGIGRKDLNNGVLIIVAPAERRVRIEVGIGLEGLLSNEKAKLIIDDHMLPRLREGRYPEAIEAGAKQIVAVLERDRRRPQPLPQKKAA